MTEPTTKTTTRWWKYAFIIAFVAIPVLPFAYCVYGVGNALNQAGL